MISSVVLLVSTQMVMLIFTKKATTQEKLPLLLCLVQFVISASLAAAVSLYGQRSGERRLPVMPRTLYKIIVPLSVVWTLGFVLFNASAAQMSPALVSIVRCVEPLATVTLGFLAGTRYSGRVLVTLIPICGGVVIASSSGGTAALSVLGVTLAMLSNVAFCLRPIYAQRLKADKTHTLDNVGVFFNVTCVSVAVLLPVVAMGEAASIYPAFERLSKTPYGVSTFCLNMLASSIAFFAYQFLQLRVMSSMTPLEFSVLTPVVKAVLIVCCCIYFGTAFGVATGLGVAMTTSGGYLFSRAKTAETSDTGVKPDSKKHTK
eukprot:m.39978 g.39978  ORF g.39978 m.39978 type:complete len:318 (+) comp18351_c0_seq1:401-1354(+)